ncbi:transglutaminase-like domain-containing protein [Ornithinimicrobium cryptoxanthini]|uniref:Transglutaminase-like domain-containing protein n=1 Tax=Ornithinimicrobium cryptoxanthini TaxID=2934161 RepID=A0ABY4YM63_9MICO|nr:transglutaminase-like domain-containing protein [Ornithinimicrobium cryptoxanthini]USQ77247.1 transglutaminase-like domain-containing protein [Ornithinimicrobium cryptoxanthini]
MTTHTGPFRPDHHTAYSDPGPWSDLLAAVEPTVEAVSAAVRNVIVHYREEQTVLPEDTRGDIHGRWIERTLERDQQRHGTPLTQRRELTERVQGCCRDHTLLACAVLREHGIAARGRVGFSRYFQPDFCHDHVVVEAQFEGPGGRWVRFDTELTGSLGNLASPTDMPVGPDSPFPTAGEVWRSWRAGEIDAGLYGVAPGLPARGPWLIQNYVLRDLAHRFGDELLLWDVWGAMVGPGDPLSPEVLELTDEVAELIAQADAGQDGAEDRLATLYATREGLRPGLSVLRFDPLLPQSRPVGEDLDLTVA